MPINHFSFKGLPLEDSGTRFFWQKHFEKSVGGYSFLLFAMFDFILVLLFSSALYSLFFSPVLNRPYFFFLSTLIISLIVV